MLRKLAAGAALSATALVAMASPALAQEVPEGVASQVLVDNLWVLIAGILVFLMQAGFALLEAGLTRAKNVGNIVMKNLMDCCAGVLAFFVVGYSIGLAGGGELLGGWFGFDGLGVRGIDEAGGEGLFTSTHFFFHAAFAATAATIVSGAMAERTRFKSYLVYSVVVTALIYPVVVSWTWGGGWLAQRDIPFSDFAGSTIVHATGGWIGLMGAIILGPRLGRFGPDGKPRALPGHSIPFVVLGALILFIGWFGFNPGSQYAMDEYVAQLAVKTLLAAAGGAVAAMTTDWLVNGRPDVSMAANGLLAGLVSITAPVGAVVTPIAILIGAIGGVIVVFAVKAFERLRVDDPVGAVSVHGVCGTWGTFSIALFATLDDGFLGRTDAGLFYGGGLDQMVTQVVFIVAHAIFVCAAAGLLFLGLKATIGLRVTPEEEMAGLDVEEHGSAGYGPDILAGNGMPAAVMAAQAHTRSQSPPQP